MKNQTSDRKELEAFIGQFIENFVGQFGDFPQIFKQLMFRWLEAENYDASRLQELVGTLEALYMAKHQRPMHSLENSVARMVAQCQGSETSMRDLVDQLRSAYRQSFQEDVFDARQEILDAIRKQDFSEEDFQHLLDSLGQAFEDRFKRRYRGQSDLLLESTAETLSAISDDEQKLQEQFDTITSEFQQLHARREALLTAISHGQHNNLSFKTKSSA